MIRASLVLAWLLALVIVSPASAENSGLFVSDDDGASWSYLQSSPQIGSVFALHLDPVVAGRILLATDQSLWLSEDDGATWRTVAAGPSDGSELMAYSIAVDPENPDRLWAGTEVGVLHSPDAGLSWTPVGSLDHPATALLAVPGPEGTRLIAGTSAGLQSSDDDGASWRPEASGAEGGVLALAFSPDGELFVGTTSGVFSRLFDEEDFTPAPGLPSGTARAFAFADDGSTYASVGSTVYRRADGWQKLATLPLASNGDPPIVGALLAIDEERVLVGTEHGLHAGPEWKLVPAFTELSHLETAPLVRDSHTGRLYLGASTMPHANALARAGVQVSAAVTETGADRSALIIGLLFVGAALLAARYLTAGRGDGNPPAAGG